MAAGSIIVDLLFRTGSFETDTNRAAKQLASLQAQAVALGTVMGEYLKEGADKAFDGLKELTLGALEADDALNNLAKQTGIAIETLGGIGFAATTAGGTLESAAAGIGKLNKSIAEAAAGNPAAGAAFAALGIKVRDASGNIKSADQVFIEIANAFEGLADGPNKAAIALQLFGKAGAEQIALLDKGGAEIQAQIDYYKQFSGVTQDVADKASQFNDTLGRVSLINKSLGQTILSETLPVVQRLADAYLNAKQNSQLFATIGDAVRIALETVIVVGSDVAFVIEQVGKGIGALAAAASHPSLAKNIFQQYNEDAAAARRSLDIFQQSVVTTDKDIASRATDYGHEGNRKVEKPQAPSLPVAGTQGKDLKAQLDGELKIIKDGEKAQADAYQFAGTYLQGVFQDGLINQQDYFDAQKQLRDANLANVVKALDDEIKDRQAAINTGKLSSSDSIAQSKAIVLAQQQRAEAITKAGATDILAAQNEAREVEHLSVSYDNLKASIMEATGNEVGGQQIKNAQALKQAALLINSIDGDPAVLGQLEKQLDLQTQRTAQQKAYSDLLDDTQRKEAEIYLDAEAGGKSELDTLAAIRDARTAAIAQLQAQADAAKRLADTVGSTDADKKRAADLALAVKKAASEIDPLARSINDSLEGSFGNAFAEFIDGTKTAKEAFQDFTNSVLSNLADIASKQLAKQIFGDTGGSSGIGGFLSGLIHGSGDPSNGSDTVGGTTGSAPDISNTVFTPEAVHLAKGTNRVPYDNFPAMLHKDEAVVPAAFNPANHGGGNVYITNNAPAEASASRDSNGDWQVVIDAAAKRGARMTTSDLASGTGPSAQAVRGRFALGPGYLPKRG